MADFILVKICFRASCKIRFYNQKQRIYRKETLLQAQSSPITFQYDAKQKIFRKRGGHRERMGIG